MTNPDNVGGLRYTDHNVMNGALCDFATRWRIDGDYIRCGTCDRPQLTSYADNDFPHADFCRVKDSPNMERRPWQTYVALLSPLCRAAPAGELADELILALGLEPDRFRTEGGALNIGKIKAAIRHPNEYPCRTGIFGEEQKLKAAPAGSDERYEALLTETCELGQALHVAEQKLKGAPAGSGEVELLSGVLMGVAESLSLLEIQATNFGLAPSVSGVSEASVRDCMLRLSNALRVEQDNIRAALLRKLQQGAE